MPVRPEIFISATSKDLGSCRQLVRDALLTLGCVPVVQDHFPPGAGEVHAMLRERIAGCQAVIHIAGECYGRARVDLDYHFSLLCEKQYRLTEALPLAEHAVAGAAKTMPADSPDRLKYEKNLADLRVKLVVATPAP